MIWYIESTRIEALRANYNFYRFRFFLAKSRRDRSNPYGLVRLRGVCESASVHARRAAVCRLPRGPMRTLWT